MHLEGAGLKKQRQPVYASLGVSGWSTNVHVYTQALIYIDIIVEMLWAPWQNPYPSVSAVCTIAGTGQGGGKKHWKHIEIEAYTLDRQHAYPPGQANHMIYLQILKNAKYQPSRSMCKYMEVSLPSPHTHKHFMLSLSPPHFLTHILSISITNRGFPHTCTFFLS